MANSLRKVLQTYSKIVMHFSCDRIHRLRGALKVFVKSLKTVLNEAFFVVNL